MVHWWSERVNFFLSVYESPFPHHIIVFVIFLKVLFGADTIVNEDTFAAIFYVFLPGEVGKNFI